MKRKMIIGLILSCIASSSFASTIHKGRIISQKEWSSDNSIQAVFADSKKPARKVKDGVTTSVDSMIGSIEAKTYAPVDVQGEHFVLVTNNTDATQKYRAQLMFCADTTTSGTERRCSFHMEEFELEPTGTYDIVKASTLALSYDIPGTYATQVSSYVEPVSTNNKNIGLSAFSGGQVFVS